MPEALRADTRTACEFLERLRPLGPWVLTRLPVERTKTLASLNACAQFIEEETEAGNNVYYTLAVLKKTVSKKPKKVDVKHTEYLHVDADPADDETPEAFKARMLPRIEAFVPKPNLVVDSGNGLQMLWRLDAPVSDETEVEAMNFALAVAFDAAPMTRNIDRILRLPGTVNFPGKTKLERGRVKCLAKLLYADDGRHEPSVFPRIDDDGYGDAPEVSLSDALPVMDLDKLHLMVQKALERCGDEKDRSVRGTKISLAMVQHGYSDDEIAAVLLTVGHKVSEHYYDQPGGTRGIRRAVARAVGWARVREKPLGLNIMDFYAYLPDNKFIYAPTGEMWVKAAIDAYFPPVPIEKTGRKKTERPSLWLVKNRPVHQTTWAPGEGTIIEGRIALNAGFVRQAGAKVFNFYRSPVSRNGDPKLAQRWLDHVHKLYPEDAGHIIECFAHRVQRPWEKINHALVLVSREQRIGKDTMLVPLREAVGHWNFKEASPQKMIERFNKQLKAVVLRINEARDLGESSRYKFYDHMKTILATPPEVVEIDEKNHPEYYAFNRVFVIITSNYTTTGLYLPPEDGRHYVAKSTVTRADFPDGYFDAMYDFYGRGGCDHVAAYLAQYDLSRFRPAVPPLRTDAFLEMVDTNLAPEALEIADAVDGIKDAKVWELEDGEWKWVNVHNRIDEAIKAGREVRTEDFWPDALTVHQVIELSALTDNPHIGEVLADRKNRRVVGHWMEAAGYAKYMNTVYSGAWLIKGHGRLNVYVKASLSAEEQRKAVEHLVKHGWRYLKWNADERTITN